MGEHRTAPAENFVIAAWRARVVRAGRVPVRMPRGPSTGELAERYKDKLGAPRYALAPADVRAADRRERIADNARAILLHGPGALGAKVAQRMKNTKTPVDVGRAAGERVRETATAFEVPGWLKLLGVGVATAYVIDKLGLNGSRRSS